MSSTYSIIGSSGELETYNDPYAGIDEATVARAIELEREIVDRAGAIEVQYLRQAQALATFKNEKLYLARGFPTFREWANSPQLVHLGYRSAQRLVQIVEKALPILEKHDAMEALPPISVMAELLPILADEDGEEKFVQAVFAVEGLTTNDARDTIKEIRGIAQPLDASKPAVFKARVTDKGEIWNQVSISKDSGDDFYLCGTLNIKKEDWPRWAERFGGFIEYA